MWKHIRAILLLPGVMTVLVPAIIIYRSGTDTVVLWVDSTAIRISVGIVGVFLIGIGLALFVAINRRVSRTRHIDLPYNGGYERTTLEI